MLLKQNGYILRLYDEIFMFNLVKRLLSKPIISFSRQEGICEKPEFAEISESFEQNF